MEDNSIEATMPCVKEKNFFLREIPNENEQVRYHDRGANTFPQVSSSNDKILLLCNGLLRNSEILSTN